MCFIVSAPSLFIENIIARDFFKVNESSAIFCSFLCLHREKERQGAVKFLGKEIQALEKCEKGEESGKQGEQNRKDHAQNKTDYCTQQSKFCSARSITAGNSPKNNTEEGNKKSQEEPKPRMTIVLRVPLH